MFFLEKEKVRIAHIQKKNPATFLDMILSRPQLKWLYNYDNDQL